jgi:hypothetical protein
MPNLKRPDRRREWREQRGISPEVAKARGYYRYTEKSYGYVMRLYRESGLKGPQLSDATRKIRKKNKKQDTGEEYFVGGMAYKRYRVFDDLPALPPQLRPEDPITTKPEYRHWHGVGDEPDDLPGGGRVKRQNPRSKSGRAHRIKHHSPWLTEEERADEKQAESSQPGGKWIPELRIGNTEEVHHDPDPGKYQLAANPYVVEHWPKDKDDPKKDGHDHTDYDFRSSRKRGKYSNKLTEQERYAVHVAKYHTPLDTESPKYPKKYRAMLERWTKNLAEQGKKPPPTYTLNYLDVPVGRHMHSRRRKSRTGVAMRLDIHPWAAERLEAAEVVYFVIEGALKADSILSYIIDHCLRASVFDVPSVTLWEANELRRFMREKLRGKIVVVVPDADWSKNDLVAEQARMCALYLRNIGGLETYIAAPPADSEGDYPHKGVDDFLGAGGRLENLHVLERYVDTTAHRAWAWRREARDAASAKRTFNPRTVKRYQRYLRGLAMLSDSEGIFRGDFQKLGRVLGDGSKKYHCKTPDGAVKALARHPGALTIHGDLATRKDAFSSNLTWEEKRDNWPYIQLKREFRGRDLEPRPLGKVLSDAEFRRKVEELKRKV